MNETAIALGFLLTIVASSAHGAGTVTACGWDEQTGSGTNLAQALTSGGLVLFNCPPGTKIILTKSRHLHLTTAINGGNEITLVSNDYLIKGRGLIPAIPNEARFVVDQGTTIFENIKFSGFTLPPVNVYYGVNAALVTVSKGGELDMNNTTVSATDTPIVSQGRLLLAGASFLQNTGIAVVSIGPYFRAINTAFNGNSLALFMHEGSVEHSAFQNNSLGGIVVDYPQGAVRIAYDSFESNSGSAAVYLSQRAGVPGTTASLVANRYANNQGGSQPGGLAVGNPGAPAIFNTGRPVRSADLAAYFNSKPPLAIVSSYEIFSDNSSTASAGAVNLTLVSGANASITAAEFLRNSSPKVGALAALDGTVSIAHGIFKANRGPTASAILQLSDSSDSSMVLANSLIVENVASSDGAAVRLVAGTVVNTTIASNTGTGIRNDSAGSAIVLVNNIVNGNSANCSNIAGTAFARNNLQFPGTSCGPDNVGDPRLDSFYVPSLSSLASHGGDVAACQTAPVFGKDVLFQSRGAAGKACSIGAFERPPVALVPRLPAERGVL